MPTTHRDTPRASPLLLPVFEYVPSSTSEATQSRQPLIRTASLPSVLWSQQWVAPIVPENKTIPLADLRSSAFREATEGRDVEKFELRGTNVRELAKSFSDILGEAAKCGDFTSVLSPQRDFLM